MRKTLIAAALAALTATILGACASDGSTDLPDGVNTADVSFATEMIPHHRQATEMARLAPDRSDDPAVIDLAERIEAAQDPEIEIMTGWLDDWDREEMGGAMDSMPGMMSADQLSDLESSTGEAFDEMFLTMMIEHHEGAIDMARTEQADGEFGDALELASSIETDQGAEIDQMRGILGS